MPDWLIAVLVTVLGGGSVAALIEYFARKSDRKVSESEKMRDELWKEIRYLRDEMGQVNAEIDKWKRSYFRILSENIELKRDLRDMLSELGLAEARLVESKIDTKNMFVLTKRIQQRLRDERGIVTNGEDTQ